MKRTTFSKRIAVVWILALAGILPCYGEDAVQPSVATNTAASTDFEKQIDEWNSLQAELAKEQIKLWASDEKGIADIKPHFVELLKKIDALQPTLRDAA